MQDREYDVFEDYEVGQAFNIPAYKNEPNDADKQNDERNDDQNKEYVENVEDTRDEENAIIGEVYIGGIQVESYKWNEEEVGIETKVYQSENDTSFNEYVRKSSKQPQGLILKWLTRTAKLVLFIMLFPLILLIVGIAGGGIATLLGGGVSLICLSIGTLIGAAFFLSLANSTLVFLMLSLSVALAATGALILLIGVSCCKALIKGIKYYRMRKSGTTGQREEKVA